VDTAGRSRLKGLPSRPAGHVVVGVEFKRQRAVTRKLSGERVEERSECWRRGLNYAVSDCDRISVIESNLGHGGGGVGNQRHDLSVHEFPGTRKPHLFPSALQRIKSGLGR
jgi:hypothetical protein